MLVIDPRHRTGRRWANDPDGLVEVAANADGQIQCESVPVALGYDGETLVVVDRGTVDPSAQPTVLARV